MFLFFIHQNLFNLAHIHIQQQTTFCLCVNWQFSNRIASIILTLLMLIGVRCIYFIYLTSPKIVSQVFVAVVSTVYFHTYFGDIFGILSVLL